MMPKHPTLQTMHTGSYRIIAVGELGNERTVATDEYNEPPNGARLIQRIPESSSPALLLIKWTENGVTSYNLLPREQ